MAKQPAKSVKRQKPVVEDKVQLYTLDVFLLSGPVGKKFAKKNPVVSRTIEIRGDQTLEDLHEAIFAAYDRFDAHMYEFQLGKRTHEGPRYVSAGAFEMDSGDDNPPAGKVDETTIGSLGLKVGRAFGYWFDFGDDWWHQLEVAAISPTVPPGKYPKVTKKVGESPPQYQEEE